MSRCARQRLNGRSVLEIVAKVRSPLRMSSPDRPTSIPDSDPDLLHSDAFLRTLQRRQLQLSIACAASFLVVVIGLPILNYAAPDLMSQRLAGFTLSWLILGVLFFPFVWIIAWIFIRKSIALEEAEVREASARQNARGPTGSAAAASR